MDLRILLPLAIAALVSCSRTPSDTAAELASAAIERVVEEVAITSGSPVTMADLSIDGMSCEMMCGGSIKKALAKLPGVNTTEITFVEGDERDHAVVSYDESKVTDAQMIQAIQALHDGQYKVMAVKITKQVPSANATPVQVEQVQEANGVSVLNPAAVIVPGILSLLSYLVRL